MDLAQAEIEARLVAAAESARWSKDNLTKVAKPHLALMILYAEEENVGICAAHLRRYEESRSAFGRAAQGAMRYLEETVGFREDPGYRGRGLVFAILSGDEDLLARFVSDDTPLHHDDLPLASRLFYGALEAVVVSDRARGESAAREFCNLTDKEVVRDKSFPGFGEGVLAILDGNSDGLRDALDRVLEQQRRYARGRAFLSNWAHALFCVPAACLVILASKRDVPWAVSDRYHQASLRFKATYLKEFDGKPIRGTPFEITTDLLPVEYVETALRYSS